jgi:tetratricopeptide (TPR) repeat protein
MNSSKFEKPNITFLQVLVIIIIPFILSHFLEAQESDKMDQNLFQKFQLSQRLFEKGKALFLENNEKMATEALKECLIKFPKYSQADYYLAQIFYKKGEFLTALKHMDKAKANYKYMADLLVDYQQKQQNDLRKQKMDLESKLTNMENKREREKIKIEIEALSFKLSQSLPVIPQKSADYYYVHGNIYTKIKKYNDALTQYMEALEINPKHGNASNNIAHLYYLAGQYQKALSYLEQAESRGIKINQEFKKAIQKRLPKKE